MTNKQKKIYIILILALVAGYAWIFLEMSFGIPDGDTVCLFKHVTGIPCPSCGSTRSVMSLAHGNFLESLAINPFGILVALIMVLAPLWISFDFLFKKRTFPDFYNRVELFLRKPGVAIPLIFLVLINWIWNISKGL